VPRAFRMEIPGWSLTWTLLRQVVCVPASGTAASEIIVTGKTRQECSGEIIKCGYFVRAITNRSECKRYDERSAARPYHTGRVNLVNSLILHKNRRIGLRIIIFVAHQFMGMYGVVWLSTLLAFTIGTILVHLFSLFGRSFGLRPVYWIMTENPFFPVQIAMGLSWGWVIYRRFRHRSMLWVWVVPVLILCYAIVNLSISRSGDSVFSPAVGIRSALAHYLGWGCSVRKDRCFDQIILTLPSYASAAYSSGAGLAMRLLNRERMLVYD
jgi:hypothetical protein